MAAVRVRRMEGRKKVRRCIVGDGAAAGVAVGAIAGP